MQGDVKGDDGLGIYHSDGRGSVSGEVQRRGWTAKKKPRVRGMRA